jgi:hypothetical protein|tara:strand:- start:120 stop:701 length:582 start_codon:yes stop_codon:yes gene_type:complete
MKKRILIFSGLLILFLSGLSFFYLTQVNPDFLRLNNGNTVTVSTDNNFSIDKVKIEFGISINTINRQNDLDLFTNKSKYTTIYNGSSSRKIKTDFGENDFLITYDDKYYLSFRQFILSDFSGGYPADNQYSFCFYLKDQQLHLKVDITGDSPMKFDRPMNLISNAELLRCNSPIDSTKTIYNMVELVKPTEKK